MASIPASSDGEASPSASVSVIASRAGSASAACTAARRSSSAISSVFIDSILTELPAVRQDDAGDQLHLTCRAGWPRSSSAARFLAAIVIGSGIAAQRLSPSDTGLELLENAAATAAGLFAIILMFGPVSGAHFNPVVSFADAALGGSRGATRSPTCPPRSPAA